MTCIRVKPERGTYDSNTLRKAIDVLAQRSIVPIRSERDPEGYALIYVAEINEALALHLLKGAGIESAKVAG